MSQLKHEELLKKLLINYKHSLTGSYIKSGYNAMTKSLMWIEIDTLK